MKRRPKVQPFEIVADSRKTVATRHRVDRPEPEHSETEQRKTDGLTLTVTPLGAFAVGALVVSALALAWVLGQRAALTKTNSREISVTVESLEDAYRLPPIPYEELKVDRPANRRPVE